MHDYLIGLIILQLQLFQQKWTEALNVTLFLWQNVT